MNPAMMVYSASSGGAKLHGSVGVGLKMQGCRRIFIALLVVVSTALIHIHCITSTSAAPASTWTQVPKQKQKISATFNQDEADAFNAIFQNWTALGLNQELITVLNWTSRAAVSHPCNIGEKAFDKYAAGANPNGFATYIEYPGAWSGVGCTPKLRNTNATDISYDIVVTSLQLVGSNASCNTSYYSFYIYYAQCGFNGIKGVLPAAISKLVNLEQIYIEHNPELTGPVPLEIWQMPKLTVLSLKNNFLVGTLNFLSNSSQLWSIDLSNNNLSGNLPVSPEGTLFTSSFTTLQLTDLQLNLSNNQLDGPVHLQALSPNTSFCNPQSSTISMDLSNNHFSGTFSTGPCFNPLLLDLSNNDFTSITFAKFTGAGASYWPATTILSIANNKLSGPFPLEILQMSSLSNLDMSGNKFFGSVIFPNTQWNSNLYTLNISYNEFNESFFVGSYLNVGLMDLSNNHFNNITFDIYNGTYPHKQNEYMPELQFLYIQNNNFSGAFPSQILTAPNLQIMYSDYNLFNTLHFPDIGTFTNSTLSITSFTNNKIEAIQYADKGSFTTFNLLFSNQLFLEGNPMCNRIENELLSIICRMNKTSLPLTVISKPNPRYKIIIATPTLVAFMIILMMALYVWRLMLKIKSLHSILAEFEKKQVKPNLYPYREIKLATKNFDKENKLGEGGFGVVYKGELFDGTMVAVKKLTMSSSQGLSEFLNEVAVISGLKHWNLVKLKGCCLGDGDQRILVFEYVENKNLGEALWIKDESVENFDHPCLDWTTRLKIIMGIARGLAYLHEELQSPIIHRDIKATNILLDKDYNPKIADFGLAYLFPSLDNDETHLTLEQVAGTRGYCAPEYALHGHISTALDVFSFGTMILEIVSGRKNIDLQKSSDEIYLRDWAWKQFEAKALLMLIDSKMKYSSSELEAIIRVINVALTCVQYKPAKRPKMHNVISMLLGTIPISGFNIVFDEEDFGDVTLNFSNLASLAITRNDNLSANERCVLAIDHEVEINPMAL